MLADSLKWILFHTRLSGQQTFLFPTLAAILWVETSGLAGVCAPSCWSAYCWWGRGGSWAGDLEMLCAASKGFLSSRPIKGSPCPPPPRVLAPEELHWKQR